MSLKEILRKVTDMIIIYYRCCKKWSHLNYSVLDLNVKTKIKMKIFIDDKVIEP